jgi:hypothetical protein
MLGLYTTALALGRMLQDRVPDYVAAINNSTSMALDDDGALVDPVDVRNPKSVVLDVKQAHQVGMLPAIEVIPQRTLSVTYMQDDEDTGFPIYKCAYEMRVDVTSLDEAYAPTARQRLMLMLAVRCAMLANAEIGTWGGVEADWIGIEANTIREAVGPVAKKATWSGVGSVTATVRTIEVLEPVTEPGDPWLHIKVKVDVL